METPQPLNTPAAATPAAPADPEAKPEDAQKKENTISNLPLLFANGYPTSLEKITESQLNKFIPFMVQCSLGNVQPSCTPPVEPAGTAPPTESEPPVPATPPWWPEDLPYTLPLVRPESVAAPSEWIRRLKELVCVCYEYHNNVFLLRFCTVLSKYEPECLRFINNYNSTTSLYDRFNNKLLVTFRNENMLYDKEYNPNRICLLPRRKTGSAAAASSGGVCASNSSLNESASAEGETEESIARPSMVEPPLFDIYLCDYCDAELYSLEACREHEKSCQETSEQGLEEDDSDVILCDEPSTSTSSTSTTTIASAVKRRSRKKPAPERDVKAKRRKPAYEEVELVESDEDQGVEEDEGEEDSSDGLTSASTDTDNQMRSFLAHFQLVSAKGSPADNWPKQQRSPRKSGGRSPVKQGGKGGKSGAARRGRNDRSVLTLQRCATVPLTSPMGKFLLRTQKTVLADDYKQERSDRVERFCIAPVIRDGVRPRWLSLATTTGGQGNETFPVTYRVIDYRGMFEKDEGYDRKYVHQYRFPRRQLSTRWRELSWMALTRVLLTSCRSFSVDLQRMTETDIRVCFLHLAIERKKRELMELRKADLVRMYEQQQRMLKRPPDECIDLCSSSEEEDDEGEESGGGGEGGTGKRRPGPKGKQERERTKRQRFGDTADHEDEMKENRAIQFVQTTLGAQRNGFLGIQMRNHSALQLSPDGGGGGVDGDLGKPLSVSVGVPGSWAAAAATAQGSPQTAAQLGVLLPNDNGVLGAGVNSHRCGGSTGNASHTGPPSSYLFLTKQQLVYQQLEVSSTESEVVPGHEVEEVVACEVNVVTTSTATSNSPLGGRRGGEEAAASNSCLGTIVPAAVDAESTHPSTSILAKQLLQGKEEEETSPVVAQPKERKRCTSSSNSINEISSTARTLLPARVAGNSGGGGVGVGAATTSPSPLSSSSSSSQSSQSSSSRLRRTSVVVDSYPLPKKMPSLIRIAPA